MNPKFAELRQAFRNGDLNSCSLATFVGTVDTIACLRPKLFILENVEAMGSETSPESNMAEAMSELRSLDNNMYAVKCFTLSSEDYLLPQTRTDVGCFLMFLGNGRCQWVLSLFCLELVSPPS